MPWGIPNIFALNFYGVKKPTTADKINAESNSAPANKKPSAQFNKAAKKAADLANENYDPVTAEELALEEETYAMDAEAEEKKEKKKKIIKTVAGLILAAIILYILIGSQSKGKK